MKTFFIFILSIGLLISIHEMGHYLAARFFNVKILRFSIGFGGKIFSIRFGKDQTEWVLSWIPLGGYVKMLDDPIETIHPTERHRAFQAIAPFKRMIIAFAGPFTNLAFAVLVYFVAFVQGVPDIRPILGDIEPNSPAAQAGLAYGQEILKIEQQEVEGWNDVHRLLFQNMFNHKIVSLEVADHNKILSKSLNLEALAQNEQEKSLFSVLGLSVLQPIRTFEIEKVLPNQAAEKAGLKPHDRLIQINGTVITRWEQVTRAIQNHPNQSVALKIVRNGMPLTLTLIPEAVKQEDGSIVGKVGIAPKVDPELVKKMMITISYPIPEAFLMACEKTWDISVLTLKTLGKILTGEFSAKHISGPLSMANYAEKSTHGGMNSYFSFLALVSLSLFVFNLLPIPVLDGGHILLYSIEIIQGKPVSERLVAISYYIGVSFVLFFTAFAFYNDIMRFFSH